MIKQANEGWLHLGEREDHDARILSVVLVAPLPKSKREMALWILDHRKEIKWGKRKNKGSPTILYVASWKLFDKVALIGELFQSFIFFMVSDINMNFLRPLLEEES